MIDVAKQYILENLVDDDTTAILLVGSWATGKTTDPFDIDLMIIKKFQLTEMYSEYIEESDFHLDIYIYDQDALYRDLESEQEDLNHINTTSLALLGLQSAQIIFDKENTIQSKIDLAKSWTWKSKSDNLFDFDVPTDLDGWIKNAVDEDLELLKIAKTRFAEGKPITTRKKDYPDFASNHTEERAIKLMDLVKKAYDNLGISMQWSEMKDAEKSLRAKEWNNAMKSMKDVLRYILRYDLPSVPQQLLDPNLWVSARDMKISDPLLEALEFAFS